MHPHQALLVTIFSGLAIFAARSAFADGFLPLIPSDVSAVEWVEFKTSGYQTPVAGMIFDDDHVTNCGVAIGGISDRSRFASRLRGVFRSRDCIHRQAYPHGDRWPEHNCSGTYPDRGRARG